MKTNINLELFKKYAPKHKLEIIESLTQEELLAITPAAIIRMVREAGELHYRSKRDKTLPAKSETLKYWRNNETYKLRKPTKSIY